MLLEEYGIKLDPKAASPVQQRNQIYAKWLESARQLGLAGDLLWMCGCKDPDTIGFRDDYTIYSADEVPALATRAMATGT